MTIVEKVAYLKGLADGLEINPDKSKEGKLLLAVLDVLDEMALTVQDLEDSADDLAEELDAVSDDLADVEDVLFGDDEDEDDCDCGCEDDEEDFFEVECPTCGEELYIDEEIMEAGVIECPGCHSQFAISDGCEDDCTCGDDCGCGCGE